MATWLSSFLSPDVATCSCEMFMAASRTARMFRSLLCSVHRWHLSVVVPVPLTYLNLPVHFLMLSPTLIRRKNESYQNQQGHEFEFGWGKNSPSKCSRQSCWMSEWISIACVQNMFTNGLIRSALDISDLSVWNVHTLKLSEPCNMYFIEAQNWSRGMF